MVTVFPELIVSRISQFFIIIYRYFHVNHTSAHYQSSNTCSAHIRQAHAFLFWLIFQGAKFFVKLDKYMSCFSHIYAMFFTIHRLYSNWVNTPFYISTVMPLLILAEGGDIRVQWTPLIFLMKQKQQPFLNPNYASIVHGWFLAKCLFFVLIVNLRLPPPHAIGKWINSFFLKKTMNCACIDNQVIDPGLVNSLVLLFHGYKSEDQRR